MALAVLDDDVDDSAYFYDWDTAPPKKIIGFWTQDRVDYLTHEWVNGTMTARAIGDVLGCTRNAVIGKANRLFLVRRSTVVQHRDRKGRLVLIERVAA